MSESAKSESVAKEAVSSHDVDIQHDDEFEDFKVQCDVVSDRRGEWVDDWDDVDDESFAQILKEQRRLLK